VVIVIIKIKCFIAEPLQTNVYLVYRDHVGVIIDPGTTQELLDTIKKLELNIEAILLTHAHFDHIAGLEDVRQQTLAPVYQHTSEESWLGDPNLNLSYLSEESVNSNLLICNPAEKFIKNEKELTELQTCNIKVLHTPGHSPGSLSFLIDNKLFSGDLIFKESIGRTDLPGGDLPTLQNSIKTKILPLAPQTTIYPGHGPKTTLAAEISSNPFFNF
jgi:glyoxylase-like metal-dependent hydrolase (beta-lactamase superfamily II)